MNQADCVLVLQIAERATGMRLPAGAFGEITVTVRIRNGQPQAIESAYRLTTRIDSQKTVDTAGSRK